MYYNVHIMEKVNNFQDFICEENKMLVFYFPRKKNLKIHFSFEHISFWMKKFSIENMIIFFVEQMFPWHASQNTCYTKCLNVFHQKLFSILNMGVGMKINKDIHSFAHRISCVKFQNGKRCTLIFKYSNI